MVNLAEAQGRLAHHYLNVAQMVYKIKDFQSFDLDWPQIASVLDYIAYRNDDRGEKLFFDHKRLTWLSGHAKTLY